MSIETEFIVGKKTILCPMQKQDIDYFADLYISNAIKLRRFKQEDLNKEEIIKTILLALIAGNIKIWLGITNQGKAYRKIGFIYLTEITETTCNINGVVDINFLKGLSKVLDRKGKPSYTEDAFMNMLEHIFTKTTIERVEANIISTNNLAIKLCKKCGLKKEGLLHSACRIEGKSANLVIMAILKKDWLLKNIVKEGGK